MILLIDNYDSFVYNLARYFERLGQETIVIRNDAITAEEALAQQPAAIVLSPGPCTPADAGSSLEIVPRAAGHVPLLGVCLGHQAIAAALGGRVVRAIRPVHGQASRVQHTGRGLFSGLANPLVAGRYHSLVVEPETLTAELEVVARCDGEIMALAHRQWPVYGVQFHPESILTQGGYTLLSNFLKLAGLQSRASQAVIDDELPAIEPSPALPAGPVTF